jgi:hypothetical protein
MSDLMWDYVAPIVSFVFGWLFVYAHEKDEE